MGKQPPVLDKGFISTAAHLLHATSFSRIQVCTESKLNVILSHGLSCTYLTDNPGENTLGPGNQDGASGFDYCSPTLPPCLYLGVNSYGTGLLSSLHLTSLPTGPDAPALWNLHSWKHLT